MKYYFRLMLRLLYLHIIIITCIIYGFGKSNVNHGKMRNTFLPKLKKYYH